MKNFEQIMEGIKNRETRICPTCRKPFNDPENQFCIDNVGECFNCDHIRSDHENS